MNMVSVPGDNLLLIYRCQLHGSLMRGPNEGDIYKLQTLLPSYGDWLIIPEFIAERSLFVKKKTNKVSHFINVFI